jgi:hypothetical protein
LAIDETYQQIQLIAKELERTMNTKRGKELLNWIRCICFQEFAKDALQAYEKDFRTDLPDLIAPIILAGDCNLSYNLISHIFDNSPL